ncbi:MAG: hypothetical protein AB1779_09880 [Candidatus Thermoplasmatota archaeon]
MGSLKNHMELYKRFKEDAKKEENYEGTRVEAYFLASFHLIEACAAKERVHINKHQKVREVLEENRFVLKEDTEQVWRCFQKLENQLRPKFAYTFTWTSDDMKEVERNFESIEKYCLKVFK